MFGDAQLNELQMRKAAALVECASDRLVLREELLRASENLARLRSPLGWLEGLRALWSGGSSSGARETRSGPGGWDIGSAIQSGLKAYAVYRSIRGFLAKRRAGKRAAAA